MPQEGASGEVGAEGEGCRCRQTSRHELAPDGTNEADFTYEMPPDGTRRDRLARTAPD